MADSDVQNPLNNVEATTHPVISHLRRVSSGRLGAEAYIDVAIQTQSRAKKPANSNSISTTKYSILSWLPKSIWAQFRRVANVYFLGISILMIIGTYSPSLFQTPLEPWSTVMTLIFVLMVTSIKEGFEDLARAKSDSFENKKKYTQVTFDSSGNAIENIVDSRSINPGDLLKVTNGQSLPVDFLILFTCNYSDDNKCYIETSNLDGEIDLKLKEGPSALSTCYPEIFKSGRYTEQLFKGSINCQAPNKNMHKFVGTLTPNGGNGEAMPLQARNVILRGSVLKNTDWVIGTAVYCGQQTKVQLNNRAAPTKMSKIEGYLNQAIILIFIAQCLITSASVISIYSYNYQHFDSKFPYVFPDNGGSGSELPYWMENWLIFFLVYNNFIPISLYVTIEMVNLGQSYLISNDKLLYREELDVACAVRSSNLVQELGGVSNIFSDKTGTLTRNEMKLVKFVLNGTMYDVREQSPSKNKDKGMGVAALSATKNQQQEEDNNEDFSAVFGANYESFVEFCRCLTTCHTVVRESDGTYRAESPDELALVEAVGKYNCYLWERGSKDMNVEMFGQKMVYECLAVNSFDSDRKRMSCLLRDPRTNKYLLVCKGADNIMLPLCTISSTEEESINKNLVELSNLGLRTLVIASKPLTESFALSWLQSYKDAANSGEKREELMAAAGAEIELQMTLVGLTAIEDRLQDEVPEVISDLSKAGIILWMLTGDKLETAINIGRSCNLILDDTRLCRIVGCDNAESYYQTLKNEYEAVCKPAGTATTTTNGVSLSLSSPSSSLAGGSVDGKKKKLSNTALVMDGPSFAFFNDTDPIQRHMLLSLGASCRSVIACRLTPTQKKDLVSLVKVDTIPRTTTLSIGDGANDVSMIMEADVGVGIYGKEGRQAANNADFAIGEFKFLRRLLLVHGRWNYIRQSRVFLYSMHKNMVLTLTLFWFAYNSAISGVVIYESWIYSSYNLILCLPIIFFGILDRDVSADFVLKHPETYEVSRCNALLTTTQIGVWVLNACLYAIIICVLFYEAGRTTFKDAALYEFGTTTFCGLCMALQAKVAFMHHQWAYPQICAMVISIVGMLLLYIVLSSMSFDANTYYGSGEEAMSSGIFWFYGMWTAPIAAAYLDAIGYYTQWLWRPSLLQEAREVEHRDVIAPAWEMQFLNCYGYWNNKDSASSSSNSNRNSTSTSTSTSRLRKEPLQSSDVYSEEDERRAQDCGDVEIGDIDSVGSSSKGFKKSLI